jgi:hypothetical protein
MAKKRFRKGFRGLIETFTGKDGEKRFRKGFRGLIETVTGKDGEKTIS